MRHLLLIVIVLITSITIAKTQGLSVEKNISGVEVGILGFPTVSVFNEKKITENITIKTELGVDIEALRWKSLSPTLAVAPRYYYNLGRRISKGKSIKGNSGNYFALNVSYDPGSFPFSSLENSYWNNDFSIVPTIGMRRYAGKHIYFEGEAGFGYFRSRGWNLNGGELTKFKRERLSLHLKLKLGYKF